MSFDLFDRYPITLTSVAFFWIEVLGVLSVVHALRRVRTAQATTAWCVGLLTLPVLVLPMYWVFGRSRFFGYRELLRQALDEHRGPAQEYARQLNRVINPNQVIALPLHQLSRVVREPVTFGNKLLPLIDGEATYSAMLFHIARAREYVLAQFYIIEDDDIGNRFADALIDRAKAGVEVRLLYDDIGCQWLSRAYLDRLSDAGVIVGSFNMKEGLWYRLQINFRNHRKVVVVDGKVAMTGGLNIGDDYRGEGSRFSHWRDTHVLVTGPAVQGIQAAFARDWHWARRESLSHLAWDPHSDDEFHEHDPHDPQGQATVIVTGPADDRQRCSLMFCEIAAIARKRLWISTPYFVPDEAVATALEQAVSRGVEVRILVPRQPDHMLVFLAGFYYEHRLTGVGVDVYRYREGFLHQKAILVDDAIAGIGSTNLDNRSLHLNFEIMVASSDPTFVASVAHMLERDFERAEKTPVDALPNRPFLFQIMVGAARLFSPVL